MASNNSRSNSDVLNRFKTQAESATGVQLKPGYNGDLTAKQAGSIGGHMVKNMLSNSNVKSFKNQAASKAGVQLKPGYNGDITTKQAGLIGGNMVKMAIDQVENGGQG